jgi:hypothetical protein
MSRNRQMVSRERTGQVVPTDSPRQTERFPLDYASWRAHLAAPGSRFEPARSTSRRIAHLDAATRAPASAHDQRHAA